MSVKTAATVSTDGELRYAILAACVVMFADGFNATMLFPFTSFMVEHLRGTSVHLGFMTGLFFTAFPIGSLTTARMWASKANVLGRRTCLLMSLSQCIVIAFASAFCPVYEVIVGLRLMQGLLSCHLPMVRTGLRERVEQLKGDEVRAFSYLQAAFAASSIAGPAFGGLLYGFTANLDFILPQALPFLVSAGLYMLALTLSHRFVVETADLSVSTSLRREQSKQAVLFGDTTMIYFLTMVTGHSFVFTGWEVGYPLLARTVEFWTAPMIGQTFLVGGFGFLAHILLTYPIMVKKLGLFATWALSWIICAIIIFIFPRWLNVLLAQGFQTESWTVAIANYVSQVFISVLQGCNFTTLQLILNGYIGAKSNSEYLLPLANAWIVSLQGLARAISPSMTGSLVVHQSAYQGNLAFDALAGIAVVSCLLAGGLLQRKMSHASAETRESKPPHSDVEDAGVYEQLADPQESSPEPRSSSLKGYALTLTMAVLNATITVITGFASKSVALPPYTENFIRCTAGTLTMVALCAFSGAQLTQDNASMKSCFWLGIADWFFLWGYVKTLAYIDSTQFAGLNVSMTPILSALVSFFMISERSSLTKVAAMVRNVVVVMFVVDPCGFFETQKASSGNSFLAGFFWCLVACSGTAFMRVIQKSIPNVPSATTSFWCFAINAVLWFPPGSIPPETRVPFLWPGTPADAVGFSEVPASVWACTIISGALGASMIAGQAVTLRHIDVGTYSNLVGPLGLVCSFLAETCMNGPPQSPRIFFGIALAVIGIAVEGVASVVSQARLSKTCG